MSKNIVEKQFTDYVVSNRESHYRLAYSYVRNPEDALDIIQESICKALVSIKSVKDPAIIKTWFYKIIVNTSLDLIRKRNKTVGFDEAAIDDLRPGEADQYGDMDLQRALEDLPVNYRSVVVLRYFEDLKIEDIAVILNENVNTVKTRLYSSLKKLRVSMT